MIAPNVAKRNLASLAISRLHSKKHPWSPADARGFHNKRNKKVEVKKADPPAPAMRPIELAPAEVAQSLHMAEQTPAPPAPSTPSVAPVARVQSAAVPEAVPEKKESTLTTAGARRIPQTRTFDPLAVLSYAGATATQTTLIIAFLHLVQFKGLPLLERAIARFPVLPARLPLVAVFLLFGFLSVRSRVFSPLDNSRPKDTESDPVFRDRLRPWWQPPPKAFPIIWSTIAILRAISSSLIWTSTKTLLCTPIFAFILHLCIGDTWNTVNNVENRLGTSFLGVLFVLASVYNMVFQYYRTLPLAGKIIAPSAVWLTVATCLVFSIWRLNSEKFGRPPLLPSKEEGPPSKWRLPLTSYNK